MAEQATVACDIRNAVATITLNRPDVLNSFDRAMAARLQELLRSCSADASVRAIVLTGAGKGFCAGQDLNEFLASAKGTPHLAGTVEKSFNPIIRLLRETEKPIVCALNGVAAGAGANIALACDFIIAAESASVIQSFAKIGLVPDSGGSFILPRIVGFAKATELIMLGEKISAADALHLGLVYRVVPDAMLSNETTTFARRLAAMPTRAIGLSKRLLNASMKNDLSRQLDLERDLQEQAGLTADFKEGVQAFVEKRPPTFRGS